MRLDDEALSLAKVDVATSQVLSQVKLFEEAARVLRGAVRILQKALGFTHLETRRAASLLAVAEGDAAAAVAEAGDGGQPDQRAAGLDDNLLKRLGAPAPPAAAEDRSIERPATASTFFPRARPGVTQNSVGAQDLDSGGVWTLGKSGEGRWRSWDHLRLGAQVFADAGEDARRPTSQIVQQSFDQAREARDLLSPEGVLEEKALVFEPARSTGLTVQWPEGTVVDVERKSQADLLGVRRGWRLLRLDGQVCSEALFSTRESSEGGAFEILFSCAVLSAVTSNPVPQRVATRGGGAGLARGGRGSSSGGTLRGGESTELVTFQPRQATGLEIDWPGGLVVAVDPQSQADINGVQPGWRVMLMDDRQCTESQLALKEAAGEAAYTLCFRTGGHVDPRSSAAPSEGTDGSSISGQRVTRGGGGGGRGGRGWRR
mmetsp:Transcript_12450/g.29332  ORF Transcript_12450/g.29332 Transcript_12450/m.29332 type:complete len:431 (+) Transcript_12450:195-1487(+)